MTQRHHKPMPLKELLALHGGQLQTIAGADDTPEARLADITAQLNELTQKADAAVTAAQEAGSTEAVAEVKAMIENDVKPQLAVLTAERESAVRSLEVKSLTAEVGTLKSAIESLRKGPEGLLGTLDEEGKALDPADPYKSGTKFSVYNDIRLANKGVAAARDRLLHGYDLAAMGLTEEGKAMTEGTPSQGGYLVRPQVERQIVESRELDNVLRGLCSSLNVTTNQIQLDQLAFAATAGWVAELAAKPESTSMTLASITASVFTAAGLVTVSNQLLADSNPAVDDLATRDLVKRLVALEETGFINGTGVGQPLGILQTPGLGTTALTSTDVDDLLIAILTAISAVEENHGAPSAILMHPRTWTRILVAQLTGGISPGAFIMGNQAEFDVTSPRTRFRGPSKILWGYPVVLTNRMPTNLGGGTESRVIVGDFREALILDRQGVTIDESSHVYFTTNQTVFRAEERVGFTAARTPLAFNIVGGAGLAGG